MMHSENEIIHCIAQIMPLEPQLFLDYDGTLVPIIKHPEINQVDSELLKLIATLNSRLETYIVTGREVKDIIKFLGDYNIIGLHGSVFHIGGETIAIPKFNMYTDLFKRIYTENLYLEKRFPGLKMYNKTGGVMFHLGNIRSPQYFYVIHKIANFLACRYKLDLYCGINIMELRIPHVNKGNAIRSIRNRNRPAIIIGDDNTDEDSFIANPDAITIKVGEEETHARFSIYYESVRPLLRKLIKIL